MVREYGVNDDQDPESKVSELAFDDSKMTIEQLRKEVIDSNELLMKQEVEIQEKAEQSQSLTMEALELQRQLDYLNNLIASQDNYLKNLGVMESTIEKNIESIEKATDVEIDTSVPEGLLTKPKVEKPKKAKKEAVSDGESESGSEFDWGKLDEEDEKPKKKNVSDDEEKEDEEFDWGAMSGSDEEPKKKKDVFDDLFSMQNSYGIGLCDVLFGCLFFNER